MINQTLYGPPQPEPVYAPGYAPDSGIRCMSLACDTRGGCAPIGYNNYGRPIYPPDCATGYHDPRSLGNDAPPLSFGNDIATPFAPAPVTPAATPAASSSGGIVGILGGMSTTTMLLIGAAAYFLFFRKGR